MADKDDQAEKTIAEDLVVTKYKMAGDIANRKQNQPFTSCLHPINRNKKKYLLPFEILFEFDLIL